MNIEPAFKVFLDLLITGDAIDLDRISDLIEILPSKLERKGERKNPRVHTYFTKNRWIYHFAKNSDNEPSELIGDFAKTFREKKGALLDISKKMDVCLFLSIYKDSCWPGLILDKNNIVFIYEVGARFEVDLYG